MRIAYVVSTLDRCGPVNVLFDIVNNLGECYDVAIFTLAKEPETSRWNDFNRLGCKVVCICESRVVSMVVGAKLLSRALRDFAPDVVHAHGFRAYLVCSGLDYPTVATVHNCIYDDYALEYGARRARWMTEREVEALDHFDYVVACSESNAYYLENKYGIQCKIVRNGVDQRLFKSVSSSVRKMLKERNHLASNKYIVVATCGCSPRKRTVNLAKGFDKAISSCGLNAELHVFGEGSTFQECCRLSIDNVVFHGFSDDVISWLQMADLFASASSSEGMPLAVLEAMSCGCPSLLSDITPHSEICSLMEKQGCCKLFDGSTQESCAQAFVDVLVARLKRPKDTSCFSASAMAKKYTKIYKRSQLT